MANPRATVEFDNIGYQAETYNTDSSISYDAAEPFGSAQAGLAVKLVSAKTVGLAGDGDHVYGRLEKVEADDRAVVQTEGFMELPGGDGATLTVGQRIVGDLNASAAAGYIRIANSAVAAETLAGGGRIIDAADTAAVMVRLP